MNFWKLIWCIQKFDSQYESAGVFRATSGRILASAFGLSDNCPVYLTGSNEDSINVWDVRDCISYQPASITSNGKKIIYHVCISS
jgi:di- and tripeptidase